MKTHWMGLIALTLAVSVNAAEVAQVKVTGDRVSLRAEPEVNSVLLDRAMLGDLLTLKDNSEEEWVGVAPPDGMDAWVYSEFIDKGKVVPSLLNIRSGPSLSHSVIGVVQRGDVVTVRGEADAWLRIAPPDETVVWISRKYVEGASAPLVNPEAVNVVKTVFQPEINSVMAAASGVTGLPDELVPDPKKEQGGEVVLSGILRSVGGRLCKLVKPDVEDTAVCYVRGNAEQMHELEGCLLTIIGRAYWMRDFDLPLIRPVKIQLSK